MNAVGLGILRSRPRARVRYISSESFVNELIESIGARRMDEFRQKNRIDTDVLLIDDIQFIGGKERTQEEFFHTFNALYQAGRQIVITSDRIPQEMPELEERLMSRLSMGLLADIQPPDFETRVAILRKQAKELRFEVPTPVYEYIAQQVRSNVRELHGALLRIGTYARLRHEPISLSVAQTQLERVHRDRTGSLTPEMILKMTAETFGVTVREIKGRKRAATVATPRKVAMFLSRSYTNASFPELGAFFGGRDHTTVMSAVKSVEKLLAAGDPVRHRIEAIERRLGRSS
jgi:chromosomal replication initiator protein